MVPPTEELFNQGIERYNAGAEPVDLIPVFKDICDRAPKSSPAWTCLSWLYLLAEKPVRAQKAAQKAVKLNPEDPQARINLALAMLETGQKGVRTHVEMAQQLIMISEELRQEMQLSIEDGFARKPDWASLKRVQDWLFEA
ncbi:MAG: hypothetical protein AAGF24_14060 [Cyanobacteria bacterium P01_H01_bin.121]